VHDDTSFYIGAPDVEAVYAYLRSKGIDVKKPVTAPYGMKQLYLTDPDGFVICFQWPARKCRGKYDHYKNRSCNPPIERP
jgi:hypothetical protein